MGHWNKSVGRYALLTFGAAILIASTAGAADVEDAVRSANKQFYSALNVMFTGDEGPMLDVWSHADDVTFLPPTKERLQGWSAVEKIWKKEASLKLGGKVVPRDVEVKMLSPTIGLTTTTEVGENPDAPGGAMSVHIRSTKLFRLEDGKWKLFYDHVDPLPALADDEG